MYIRNLGTLRQSDISDLVVTVLDIRQNRTVSGKSKMKFNGSVRSVLYMPQTDIKESLTLTASKLFDIFETNLFSAHIPNIYTRPQNLFLDRNIEVMLYKKQLYIDMAHFK